MIYSTLNLNRPPSSGNVAHYLEAADLALEIKVGMTASSSSSSSETTSLPSSSPIVSTLSIDNVNGLHSGNYTCAPSNARAAAIMVHVVDGEWLLVDVGVNADFMATIIKGVDISQIICNI